MAERDHSGGVGWLPGDAGVFRDLLDAAPDALLIVDEGGRIVFANAQTEAMFGYRREDLLGQSVEILVPARLRGEHMSHRRRYASEPRKRPMGSGLDLTAVRKDGTEVPVEISLSPHRTAGGLLYSAAIRDITHRVGVERDLRQARAQAEQASTAKSRFLAAASHDLRQPLQAAILYNNVLKRQLDGTAHADTVGKLQSSLEALRDLLNRLLDVSRLEAGAIAPEMTTLSVRILFERLHDEFAPQAQEKGLELKIRSGEWRVRSDPQLLEQLLRNLVSNAIRYTERGRVLVACRRADGGDLRIQVWDTGIGIAPAELEAIFDEFYQVSNPARRRQAGLGLGLAIVRGLSQLLGHPVTVRSTLGRGSVFELRVPRAAPRAARPLGGHRALARAPAVVVIIDDDPDVLDSLRLSLEQTGHRVVGGSDSEEVLRLVRRLGRPPDLILSDYRLGAEITGVEAIGRLRQELGEEIPAIVITGDSSSAALREVRAAGFPVMHKPVDPEQLEDVIAKALAARDAASE